MSARVLPDPTVYREEDEMGEHELQTYILELLRPLLARFLAERGERVHVGSDQFVYYRQDDATACVAPDLYVLPGVPQEIAIDTWRVWERGGVVPVFALEVVGRDPKKDYEDAPRKYAELGTSELVVFDPFPGRDRVRFTCYRRVEGTFQHVRSTDDDSVFLHTLSCHLRVVGEGAATRLRVATGTGGEVTYPTEAEAERAQKEAALARIAELEAKLRA